MENCKDNIDRNRMKWFDDLSDRVKYNFFCLLITSLVSTTSLISSGITRLTILGISDILGWIMIGIPFGLVLLTFIAFGCYCGYMFIQMINDFHQKYLHMQMNKD